MRQEIRKISKKIRGENAEQSQNSSWQRRSQNFKYCKDLRYVWLVNSLKSTGKNSENWRKIHTFFPLLRFLKNVCKPWKCSFNPTYYSSIVYFYQVSDLDEKVMKEAVQNGVGWVLFSHLFSHPVHGSPHKCILQLLWHMCPTKQFANKTLCTFTCDWAKNKFWVLLKGFFFFICNTSVAGLRSLSSHKV